MADSDEREFLIQSIMAQLEKLLMDDRLSEGEKAAIIRRVIGLANEDKQELMQ